ncbi:unnamed protein product [Psylliodes chrysocephalus]|uniref:Uncharacterized protein n=1 Tax=Psylliodes chrysocephalus TaxID=3402493 RepID=A0A9P0GGS0_9CUCU|nr:unnamed protein product [Psylliodes chrysocephala]
MDHFKSEIKKAPFVSIALHETTDVANLSQLSIVVRYVLDGIPQERFLGFWDVTSERPADALFKIVCDIILSLECGSKLVAQSYDGAAEIAGHLEGPSRQLSVSNINSKPKLTELFDRLETQLQILGVTTEKCATILLPLVESCIPQDTLRAWLRNSSYVTFNSQTRLEKLLEFLKKEVKNEERIFMAVSGFEVPENKKREFQKECNIATVAPLISKRYKKSTSRILLDALDQDICNVFSVRMGPWTEELILSIKVYHEANILAEDRN